MIRVGVVGSRQFPDEAKVRAFVAALPLLLGTQDFIVVSGGARDGVDNWAEDQARIAGYNLDVMKAQWEMYGNAAGIIRNGLLVKSCDKVYIFWDGKSPGSRNVIRECMRNKVEYEVIGDD